VVTFPDTPQLAQSVGLARGHPNPNNILLIVKQSARQTPAQLLIKTGNYALEK
jgi:hypothetical protein